MVQLGFANVRVFFLNPSSEYECFFETRVPSKTRVFSFFTLKKKKTTQKIFYLQFSLYQLKKDLQAFKSVQIVLEAFEQRRQTRLTFDFSNATKIIYWIIILKILGTSIFTKPEFRVRVKLVLGPSFTRVFVTRVQTLLVINF